MKAWRILLVIMLLLGVGGVMAQNVAAQDGGEEVRAIFMHHSTGAGVMNDGGVREALTELGYSFWDHDYNDYGLSDGEGQYLDLSWDVPDDNTDPDGWYTIFNQSHTDPPTNTLSHMLEYDVIIFKSCFPSSAIYDEWMFEEYQRYFLSIRDVIDRYPDKIFIPWTTPPLVPNETNLEEAARARRWAEYLTSDDYLDGHPNIFVYDFFSLMADDDGFLRADYRADEWDSHPNGTGNRAAGAVLVDFVDQVIGEFVPGEPSTQPVIVQPEGAADDVEPESPPAQPVEMGAMIADFEGGDDDLYRWWMYSDGGAPEPELGLVKQGYGGDYSLRISFETAIDHYMGFGTDFPPQDWSASDGVGFFWRSEEVGTEGILIIFVQDLDDPGNPTPFVAMVQTPGDEWTEVQVFWEEFIKPDWVGDAGVAEFDPSRVVGVSFDVGHWERAQRDIIWLDDMQIIQALDE